MQGLWKNSASGWKKDCRRKKQKRKHFLKDKYNLIQKEIWSGEYNLVSKNKYVREIKYNKVKSSQWRCCEILFEDSIVIAWNDCSDSVWYKYSYITGSWDILSWDNSYYKEGYKKEIKIFRVIEYYNKEYREENEIEEASFDKDKLFYKNMILDKYKYCFNKYHWYGSYKEFVIERRNVIKTQLKNWEKYDTELSYYKKKYVWLWG